MKNNQKGFSALETLLVLVIIGALIGVGWYVWKQRSKTKYTGSSNQVTGANRLSTNETNTKINANYSEYTNKEFGFKFDYPTAWGEVSVRPSYSIGKAGKAYDIQFGSGYGKVGAGFVTKDWVQKDSNATGFVTYEACKKSPVEDAQVFLYKSDTACVSVTGTKSTPGGEGDGSDEADIVLQVKFTKSKKVAGLAFLDAPLAVQDINESTLKNVYGNNGIEFVKIAKSAQEI